MTHPGTVSATLTHETLLSLEAVRQALGISRATLHRLISRGELAVIEIGSRRLVEPSELRRFVANHRRPEAVPAL